ncbi:uncharacterized protein LOC116773077 [Danaus plexippus]|uniref:uncharacterized protein LOC116773077 n=1 Tax=Danaus plexippus TaxID=13037 RepID=UPI002AB131EF|nr:uncharacterized protein LOC116773077 [Danaus plexippus]
MLFLCLVFFSVLVTARAVYFTDCGSAYDLIHVEIEGCGSRLPCYVALGDRIPVRLDFYADFESHSLDQDVFLNINNVQARTPVTPEQCESEMCPIRTDALSTITSVMSVPTRMALNQRGYLTWRVYNEDGRQVLCYFVMVQTQTYIQKTLRNLLEQLDSVRDTSMAFTRPLKMNFVLNKLANNQKINQTALTFPLT